MNPIESVSAVIRNYFDFSGRSPRSEFWWFFLLISVVLVAVVSAFSAWGLQVAEDDLNQSQGEMRRRMG